MAKRISPKLCLCSCVLAACLVSFTAAAETSVPDNTLQAPARTDGSLTKEIPAANPDRAPLPGTLSSPPQPAPQSPAQDVPQPAGAPSLAPPAPIPAGAQPPDQTAPHENKHGVAPSALKAVTDKITTLGKTADKTHDFLERSFLQEVISLDNFFAKPNSDKELNTSYFLAWRNSLRLEEGGGLAVGSSLRANIVLSRINDRLQLALSGANQPDPLTPRLPSDPGNPGFDRNLNTARLVNTELRYQLLRAPATDCFLGAGFDLKLPANIFARARFQHYQTVTDLFLIRYAETLFAKTPYGVGETTELSLERSLTPKTVLRLANSATVSQEVSAMEWGSELSLLYALSPRSALTLTGGVYGNTGFDDWITSYQVLLRYRRNFLRSWLFFELEPQEAWPRQADGAFRASFAFTLRLEVQFQGGETRAKSKP